MLLGMCIHFMLHLNGCCSHWPLPILFKWRLNCQSTYFNWSAINFESYYYLQEKAIPTHTQICRLAKWPSHQIICPSAAIWFLWYLENDIYLSLLSLSSIAIFGCVISFLLIRSVGRDRLIDCWYRLSHFILPIDLKFQKEKWTNNKWDKHKTRMECHRTSCILVIKQKNTYGHHWEFKFSIAHQSNQIKSYKSKD